MADKNPPTCLSCGMPRPAAAPAGLCPRCLLGNALGDESDLTAPVAPAEPGRVLETLAATVGPIPRVLLPEVRDDLDSAPLVRPSSPEMPAPADRPARIQLLGEIARGGMGTVLKGRDPDLGRDLAVKVLREDHRDNPDLVRRFAEEAQIAGQLQHPGVVPVYELGCFADARPYFTMKLVKGRNLAQLLADRSPQRADRSRLLGIFEQVCQTVAYAHARSVIHRDLKPSNIMVGSFGEVQVMDWGLAKVLPRGGATDDAAAGRTTTSVHETVISTARSGSDSDMSHAGSVLGTPSYMAPEQARGEIEDIDERADVFALGSILCEILTSAPAFTGRSSAEIQRRAARGSLADALARLTDCTADAELVSLARDCLALAPDDRPRDAAEVARRLTAYLAGVQDRLHAAELAHAAEAARSIEATRTAAAAEAQARAERRARRLVVGMAAAVLAVTAVTGGGAVWLQRQRASRAAVMAQSVEEALAEAMKLEGEARGAVDDPSRWAAALAEARRADDLLKQGPSDFFLRRRVNISLENLVRQRDESARRADRAKVDRKLLAELAAARIADSNLRVVDVRYAAAFRAAGLDVDRTDATTVGAWIAARSKPIELACYLDDWSHARFTAGEGDGRQPWKHFVRAARVADPEAWRDTLRIALEAQDLAVFRRLADDEKGLEKLSVVSLNLLGIGLKDLKDDERAERIFRLAWLRSPNDYWANFHVFQMLGSQPPASAEKLKRWRDERIRYKTVAVAANPDTEMSFALLGDVLWADGRIDEAIATYREECRRHPDQSYARSQLAALLAQHDPDASLAVLRELARPGGGPIEYYNLGVALDARGQLEEAAASFREAVRLDGTHVGNAIFNLGYLLRRMGRYEEAHEVFRRAVELAHAEARNEPEQQAQRELKVTALRRSLAARLPDLISGKDRPKNHAELYEILFLFHERGLHATGARMSERLFDVAPALAADHERLNLFNAACLAALAGCGMGTENPPVDDAEKTRLRAVALAWLRRALTELAKQLQGATKNSRITLVNRLNSWRTDADLTCVRLPVTLAKLPEPEQKKWRSLWTDVDALLAKAREPTP